MSDTCEIDQIIDHPPQMLRLSGDHVHSPYSLWLLDADVLHHIVGTHNGCQRISKFVTQHRQEFVLLLTRFRLGPICFPQLPAGRSESRQGSHDSLVFPVEFPLIGMRYDPNSSDGFAVMLKRNEQRFHRSRLDRERWKAAIGEVHQLRSVLVDAHAAWTSVPGHRVV